MHQLQTELRQYIASDQIDRFFERWAEAVRSESQHANLILLKQGDWNRLRREERMGTTSVPDASQSRARLRLALLEAVDELQETDLRETPPALDMPPVHSENTELVALLKRKIDALQKELILVQGNDANRAFKLEEDIRQAQNQLQQLLG